ncbi:mechanosensitive ion channel family protein [Neoroseomonas terrae]|uniref:mechanosensitive ion channel family protein n=1 Tax=Neoroseomonas terrae TaxID=424799 RepID=UPI001BAB4BAF|nr:mechanosensitive ion channel family protein [Neoroseomonas terrae]
MMFDEALGRLEALGHSAAAMLPGVLLGLVVFGLGLLLVRGIRAAVTRAASRREASAGSAAVLGRIGGGVATLIVFLIVAAVAFPSVSAADLFGLLGIGGVAIGFAFRDVLQNLPGTAECKADRALRHRLLEMVEDLHAGRPGYCRHRHPQRRPYAAGF